MRILKLIIFSIFWLIIWFIAYELISKFIAVNLGWNEESNNTFYQCFIANLIRAVGFFILIYCQLSIVRNALCSTRLLTPLNFLSNYKNGLTRLNEITKQKTKALAFSILFWLFYYYILSVVFLFLCVEHFIGDCDSGDLECTCNNFIYLLPFILVVLIISVIYIISVYIVKSSKK